MKAKAPNTLRPGTGFVSSIYAKYGADLHHFLLHRLRRDQDASDVAQEVYLRLLRLKSQEFVRQPHAYVFHIACQVIGQLKMREKADHDVLTYDTELATDLAEHPPEFDPDPLLGPVNADYQLKRLLEDLSDTHRKVFILRRCEGLSWAEIAGELNLSVHTVKKYIAEANARISAAALEG